MRSLRACLPVLLLAGSLAGALAVPATRAQTTDAPTTGHARPPDFRVQRLTTVDGLPSNLVRPILQDHLGFLWIGTESGLARYDGYTFTSYLPGAGDSTSLGGIHVWTLFEDASGDLWVGTVFGGLSRFDRETERFTRYRHDPNDPNTLSDGTVYALYESPSAPGVLWIGTGGPSPFANAGGLDRLDVETGTFTHYLADQQVWSILEDRDGALWVGTQSGLLRFDSFDEPGTDASAGAAHTLNASKGQAPATVAFTRFLPDPAYPRYDPAEAPANGANSVYTIHEDREGTLWVGTFGGLHRFDQATGTFRSFFPDPARRSDPGNMIFSIREDQAGTLWVGAQSGLFTFDREGERFTRYEPRPGEGAGWSNEQEVWSIHEDRLGGLWIGTVGGGLLKLDRTLLPFVTYQHDPDDPNSLSDNRIRAILEDREGLLWIGHDDGRIDRLNRPTGRVTRYDATGINRGPVSDIYEDRAGVLWVTISGDGLKRLVLSEVEGSDRKTGAFTHYRHDPNDPGSLSDDWANLVLEDRAGHLWVGTFFGGLNRLVLSEVEGSDRATGRFTHYRYDPGDPHSLGSDNVITIYEDRSGTLWVGTQRGLHRLVLSEVEGSDPPTGTFTNYHAEDLGNVMMLHEDHAGRFWVATAGNGLHRFDRATGTSTAFTTADGLPHNVVRAILEDEQGALWLSTDAGLSRFDPRSQTFRNFYTRDGLPGDIFNEHAHFKSARGELFFGGKEGMISFFPEQIEPNAQPPQVVLTGLRIAGEPVVPDPAGPLKASMTVAEAVRLPYDRNDLTFDYVGLHFVNPAENRYRYLMEGYDSDWVEAGIQRSARYPKLPPGSYVFRVQAAGSDGAWSEEGASVRVVVLPPWWRTWWAYALYGLLFAAGVFAVDRFQRRRLIRRERERAREREREQAREIERAYHQLEQAHAHLKAVQQQLVHAEKMASLGALTAGIAHEIKNPLNFVNNFAELNQELAQELTEALEARRREMPAAVVAQFESLLSDMRTNAEKIHEQGRRADSIVRAMMQHASGGTGGRQPTDVNTLVEEYVSLAYHGMRAQTPGFNATIERDYGEGVGPVEMVPQEIGRVLINLLNNAFYAVHARAAKQDGPYAPGVAVSTRRVDEAVEIRVSDNGPGIPAGVREKIFEPFFTTKPTGQGTGLGLSLAYDIVTQGHGGMLRVESVEGQGATFTITLPCTA